MEVFTADPSLVSAIRAVAIPLFATSDALATDVAKALGIETKALERALIRQGTSFAREIRALKNETAQDGLVQTDLPIAEIGAQIGYFDAGNFTRYFKSQFGMTPVQFRQASQRRSGKAKT